MGVALFFPPLLAAEFLVNEARHVKSSVAIAASVRIKPNHLHNTILKAAPTRPAHLDGLATGAHATQDLIMSRKHSHGNHHLRMLGKSARLVPAE